MVNVSCHSSTVLRQKPQTNSCHPPISHSTTPSVTGGTRWYLFSQRSSGNFAKSAMYSIRVSLYLSERSEGTRLNSSHSQISYAVFCLKKKKRAEGYSTHGRQTARQADRAAHQAGLHPHELSVAMDVVVRPRRLSCTPLHCLVRHLFSM